MRGRPDEEVLKELMDEMNAMDREKLGKKRQGPSITIAVGIPKGEEEKEEMTEENSEASDQPAADFMGMDNPPVSTEPPVGVEEEENELMFDGEEKALIEEAKSLGIDDPEEIDMRLLKKLIERKKASV